MNTKSMYDLKDTLCSNLEQYARKENFTRNDLDTVHMLTDTIKNIDKIAMAEPGASYGAGDWTATGSYSNGMPMNGYSGRRGRGYSREADDTEYRMRREMY